MLQQANPQGLVLVPWSGGAIPLNQAAGSGQLSTAGINGIIYMSPGNPGGFSKTLQDIPTFTYWGNGNTNTAVYNSNSLMFDGVAVDLPPGGSATILGCDHNFGCSWNSGEVPHPPSDCKRNTSALTKHEKGLEQEHPPSLLDVVEAEVAYAPPDVSYLGSVPDVGDLDRETYEGKLN
jgi:hypothetical protein